MDDGRLVVAEYGTGAGLAFAYLATGLWLTATAAAWLLALRALVAAFASRRRLVGALRWATYAVFVDLFGLIVMVTLANPIQWRTGGWLVSLAPLALSTLAVLLGTRAEPPLETARCRPALGHLPSPRAIHQGSIP
jgi:hypothetical protein